MIKVNKYITTKYNIELPHRRKRVHQVDFIEFCKSTHSIRNSPPISKFAWLPHRGDRHRGVDMCDALEIDEKTWHRRVDDFQKETARYYKKITPELVIDRLEPMLRALPGKHERNVQ